MSVFSSKASAASHAHGASGFRVAQSEGGTGREGEEECGRASQRSHATPRPPSRRNPSHSPAPRAWAEFQSAGSVARAPPSSGSSSHRTAVEALMASSRSESPCGFLRRDRKDRRPRARRAVCPRRVSGGSELHRVELRRLLVLRLRVFLDGSSVRAAVRNQGRPPRMRAVRRDRHGVRPGSLYGRVQRLARSRARRPVRPLYVRWVRDRVLLHRRDFEPAPRDLHERALSLEWHRLPVRVLQA